MGRSVFIFFLILASFGGWLRAQDPAAELDPWEGQVQAMMKVADSLAALGKYHLELDTLHAALRLEDKLPQHSGVRSGLYHATARACGQMKAFSISIRYYQKEMETQYARGDSPKIVTIGALASAYMLAQEWPQARKYFLQGLELSKLKGKEWNTSPALNNLGILYLKMGKLDSAEYYLLKSLHARELYPFNDSLFKGSIRDNLARTLYQKGDKLGALELFLKNIQTYGGNGKKSHGTVQALLGAANIYMELGNFQAAAPLLRQAHALMPEVRQAFREDLQEQLLSLQIREAEHSGDQKRLLGLLRIRKEFQDSLLGVYKKNIDEISSLQASYQEREFGKNLRLAQGEAQKARDRFRITLLLAVLILILLALAAFLAFRWSRTRSNSLKRKIELNETRNNLLHTQLEMESLEKENLALKVKLKEQDLTNFALENQRKNDLIQEIENQLRQIRSGNDSKAMGRDIIKDLRLKLQDQNAQKLYQENIDEVNAAFEMKLLERFPDLTPNEIELCGMLRLGMKTKEISAMRNVTSGAVQQARKRLRKKLNLDQGEDLIKYLKTSF